MLACMNIWVLAVSNCYLLSWGDIVELIVEPKRCLGKEQ